MEGERAEIGCPQCRELRQRVAELESENRQLAAQVARLGEQVEKLTAALEAARRGGKRQAAPFSRGQPKAEPKKPGRKPGDDYGTKAHRSVPPPEQIEEIHEAPLPPACPQCGGAVTLTEVAQQYQVEIPRKPLWRQFQVQVGHCQQCGRRVQGRHSLQTSNALGSAASQLGPEAQAAVVQLNKDAGLSYGKVRRVFQQLFGITLSRGGAAQVVRRTGQRLQPIYQTITQAVRRAAWVVPDETGWRIGGRGAWLHVFASEAATCYAIDRARGYEVAQRVLGDYQGRLIHDGWASYDCFWRAVHQQCLGHLLRRCRELLETATRGAVRFPRQIKALLQHALALRDRRDAGQISAHGLAVARGRLRRRLDRLLVWERSPPANERFAAHLARHAHQILTFLHDAAIPATNWPAEQALRPAVVNRKVWGGNRTDAGAHAQETILSFLRTCWQHGLDSLTLLAQLLCGRPPSLLLARLAS
jgi:transposase